jgi:F-type H+-transporting ATPase subunit c
MFMEGDIMWAKAMAYLAAALVMGLGSIGPSLGQGLIGMKACENAGKYPANYSNIRMLMIISISVIETASIYCLLIALLLIFMS